MADFDSAAQMHTSTKLIPDYMDLSTASTLRPFWEATDRKVLQQLENLPLQGKKEVKGSLLTCCTACRVLAGQVERVITETAALERQTDETCLAASDTDASLQVARSQIVTLREENAVLKKRCHAVQQDLEDQELVSENVWARWRDEVSAWRTLHNDAQLVMDTALAKVGNLEQKNTDLQRAFSQLPSSIEATHSEVARYYSVQSGIEADSSQDADWARNELKRLEQAAARARTETTAAREERAAAERQLIEQSDEAARQLSRLNEYQVRYEELKHEADVARQVLKEIRQECIEERRCCSNAVDLLHEAEQRAVSKCERGCSPMPDPVLGELTKKLETCMQRARTLEADNEAISRHRCQEAESWRDTVEHLRARVRRYRARCDDLRAYPQQEGSPQY